MGYYDGGKILGKRDINGNKPGLYIVCGNRSSGKSTFFNSYAWKKIKSGAVRNIGYIVRYKYELSDCCEQFFEPIKNKGLHINYEKPKINERGYAEMRVDGEVIGYGLAISSSDKLKKVSNLFYNIDLLIWDEFQSFTGDYLKEEITLFRELIKTVCRGGGEFFRYVPCICISNAISMLCPLLSSTDIPMKCVRGTKFLRGNGYVFEQNMNKLAQVDVAKNPIIVALGGEEISDELIYTSDKNSCIEKPPAGKNYYLMTINVKGKEYSIRKYDRGGAKQDIFYCSKKIDKTFSEKYAADMDDISGMWVAPPDIGMLRLYYQRGQFRFSDLEARGGLIEFIKY